VAGPAEDGMSEEDAFAGMTDDLLSDDESPVSPSEFVSRKEKFHSQLGAAMPEILGEETGEAPEADVGMLMDAGIPEEEAVEMSAAAEAEADGVPFSVTNTPVVGGPPDPPVVFGDPSSTFARPGPSADQLAKRAAEEQRLIDRGTRADQIRWARDPRNNPHFWYTRTGDARADAAMGAQGFQLLQEQVRGRTAREQMLAQQVQYDKALEFKSQDQLRQIASDPMSPPALQRAARMKFASNAGIDVPAGGAGGDRVSAGQAGQMLEAQNPGMMAQLEGAFQAPDGGSLNEDIGGYGSAGDLMENISGWFGGTVRRTNSDQLSYLVENLAGLMTSEQINADNIAMVGPVIGAKLDAALKRELGTGGNLSREGMPWSTIQQFMSDLMAGRMPAGYEGLSGVRRRGGWFNRSR